MRAYYHDNKDEVDFREEHDSGVAVSESKLSAIGVLYYFFDNEEDVNGLAKERNYKNRDQVVLSKDNFPGGETALKAKLDSFYEEHLHEDEEIRYILDGEGYFDVRDDEDRWIRTKLTKGDLLILPSGIYHRFTLSQKNYVKALRLFKDEPKWLALNRPADNNKYRQEYLNSIKV
ncbi:hypothetical protein PACTADRAFT_51978 [Pachysolen tannophilus NRRL Y-2460]|uniref:Acireductone dioxygenase n=1 Tax=Pachysolen tannophilus NRRL Y-2460 TaxID=669874 RepID=A0A1E4TNT1_PACTA|nr:hypothetical protein PACTADRAFT_51978 [Pachysolen tannophilus NRRL Y-2460]